MSVSSKQPFSFDLTGRVAPRPAAEKPGAGTSGESCPSSLPAVPTEYRRVCMRLPCDLYDQVKAVAVRNGSTVTDVVAAALRMRLARPDLFETVGESRLG